MKSPQVLSHLLLVVAIFFRGRTHVPLDFPGQIPTSPIPFAFTRGRVFGGPLLSETRAPGGLWETPEVHGETGYIA